MSREGSFLPLVINDLLSWATRARGWLISSVSWETLSEFSRSMVNIRLTFFMERVSELMFPFDGWTSFCFYSPMRRVGYPQSLLISTGCFYSSSPVLVSYFIFFPRPLSRKQPGSKVVEPKYWNTPSAHLCMCRVTQRGGDFIIIIHNFHLPHVLTERLGFQACFCFRGYPTRAVEWSSCTNLTQNVWQLSTGITVQPSFNPPFSFSLFSLRVLLLSDKFRQRRYGKVTTLSVAEGKNGGTEGSVWIVTNFEIDKRREGVDIARFRHDDSCNRELTWVSPKL